MYKICNNLTKGYFSISLQHLDLYQLSFSVFHVVVLHLIRLYFDQAIVKASIRCQKFVRNLWVNLIIILFVIFKTI